MAVNERFDFSGRSVLITGGGKGIGKVYVEEFAKAGARVATADIDVAAAESVAASLTEAGLQAFGLGVDIADEASVRAAAAAVLDRFGSIDVLINNASLMSALPRRSWLEIPVEEWDRVMAVNLRGMFLVLPRRLPRHEDPKARQDRQHLLVARLGRNAEPSALHNLEGRRDRLYPCARPRGR